MNIVWIEDFGGEQPSPEHFAAQLFAPLIQSAKAMPLTDWIVESGNDGAEFTHDLLAKYFSENIPEHQVTLITNVNVYLDRSEKCDAMREFDLFILDINLTSDDQPDSPLRVPEPFANNKDFHRRAGLYIYNHLLARRFPKERICLLTGEDTTLSDYERLCAEALVEPPWRFHKSQKSSGQGITGFHEWLLKIVIDDDYLRFRRGALDGITWVREQIGNEKDKTDGLHFRGFLNREQQRHFANPDANDYLNGLDSLLPAAIAADQKSSVLRLFLRALAHEWENRAKPSHKKHVPALLATGNVMKLARNCLTHGRLLDSATPRDMAILLILNFRAMFGAPIGSLRDYERDLLHLFNGPSLAELEVESILANVDNLVREYLSKCVAKGAIRLLDGKPMRSQHEPKDDGNSRPFAFFDVVNELSMAAEPVDLPFPMLVVGTFWLTISENDRPHNRSSWTSSTNNWLVELHHRAFTHYFGGET